MTTKTTACAAMLMVSLAACGDNSGPGTVGRTAEAPSRAERQIDEALRGFTQGAPREGLAAAIAIDVSGSMNDRVTGEDGRRARKIDVARRAARDLIEQFAAYADAHTDEPVLLGVYEFSRRSGEPDARAIMPMGPPDRTQADAALSRLDPDGGTPIGQAMLVAKRELDATGLSRRHLLVVSDGENTDGFKPEEVAAGIARRPDAERPSMYFVAFDIEARRFNAVREAGGLVLAAANGKELNDTLDMLLTGKILIEK
ncbi:MAG: vWA domain-containing protein [Vicinamibacterales bacterium]